MKKIISTALVLVLIISLFSPTSFAYGEEDYSWIVREVEKSNQKIEEMIEKAVDDVDKVLEKYELGIYTEAKKNEKIDKIVDKLIIDSEKVSINTIEKAAEVGITVECYYEEVTIGEKTVFVDPLRIVGF